MARVVWFDIPVADMGRAIAFYRALHQVGVDPAAGGRGEGDGAVRVRGRGFGGVLLRGAGGPAVALQVAGCFDANPSLDDWLSRVEPAGGRILVGRTPVGEDRGYYAYIEDSEGNRVGLNASA